MFMNDFAIKDYDYCYDDCQYGNYREPAFGFGAFPLLLFVQLDLVLYGGGVAFYGGVFVGCY